MAIIGATSDFVTIFSSNFLRVPGASITASASRSGYFPEFAIDGDRVSVWHSSSTSTSDSLTIDTGAILAATGTHFWLHGNVSDFTVSASSDGSSYGTILDVSGQAAASINAFASAASTAYRYWRLTCSNTITSGQFRQVFGCGLYHYEFQFGATYNPLHNVQMMEAGQETQLWNGGIYKPTIREIYNISLPIERLVSADYVTLKAAWRSWKNNMCVVPEPYGKPDEVYDVVAGPLELNYRHKYRAIGYAGNLTFRSY